MLVALPLAVAIALSPFAIIPAIVLLLTPRPREAAGAFLAGWLLGVALVAGVAFAIMESSETTDAPARWRAWAGVVLGAALVVLGVVRWSGRGRGGTPAWLQGVQSATPRKSLLLGLTLSAANPKVMLLAVAGGAAIGAHAAGPVRAGLALLGFALVSASSVALPVAFFVAAPGRAMPLLARLRAWLEANAEGIVAAVVFAIGAVMLAKGLRAL